MLPIREKQGCIVVGGALWIIPRLWDIDGVTLIYHLCRRLMNHPTPECERSTEKTTNVAEEKNVNRALCVSESGEIIKSCCKFFFSVLAFISEITVCLNQIQIYGSDFVSFRGEIEFSYQNKVDNLWYLCYLPPSPHLKSLRFATRIFVVHH